MGVVKNNAVTKGFSGKFGDDISFRQVGDRTVFSKPRRKGGELSEGQQAHRLHFLDAIYYAKSALADPTTKEVYRKMAAAAGMTSAQTAAVTDYLTLPKIASVHAASYKGAIGDALFIAAVNDFKITQIDVTIHRADSTVIETGPAAPEGKAWKYVATVANADITNTKIVIKAKDRLGKEATFEYVMK